MGGRCWRPMRWSELKSGVFLGIRCAKSGLVGIGGIFITHGMAFFVRVENGKRGLRGTQDFEWGIIIAGSVHGKTLLCGMRRLKR